jgi:hypothetical protein
MRSSSRGAAKRSSLFGATLSMPTLCGVVSFTYVALTIIQHVTLGHFLGSLDHKWYAVPEKIASITRRSWAQRSADRAVGIINCEYSNWRPDMSITAKFKSFHFALANRRGDVAYAPKEPSPSAQEEINDHERRSATGER